MKTSHGIRGHLKRVDRAVILVVRAFVHDSLGHCRHLIVVEQTHDDKKPNSNNRKFRQKPVGSVQGRQLTFTHQYA